MGILFFNACHGGCGKRTCLSCACCLLVSLLVVSVGHRLCIDFTVSRAIFLTTLRSHLDVTCYCYYWPSLFDVDFNYSYTYLVNYSYFGSC